MCRADQEDTDLANFQMRSGEIPLPTRKWNSMFGSKIDQVGRKGNFAEESLAFPELSEFLDFSDLKIVNGDDPV